jgi:hypothetical protein
MLRRLLKKKINSAKFNYFRVLRDNNIKINKLNKIIVKQ